MTQFFILALFVFSSNIHASAHQKSMECAKVARDAALAVFNVSAKQTPNEFKYVSSKIKSEKLSDTPAGRYSSLQYRVDVTYKNALGHEGSFFYRVETRDTSIPSEKCFIEAVAYDHED